MKNIHLFYWSLKRLRMKEDISIKSKTSLEKTGNIETEASVWFNGNSTTSPT